MAIYLAVLLTFLQGMSTRGAKMLVSLAALNEGANPFQVGLIGAMFPLLPLLLAVYAGKVSDRVGVRVPLMAGGLVIAAGILVPLAWRGIPGLVAAGICVGFGHIFYQVSAQNLIGALGGGEERTRNFATFSLGQSMSAFSGPLVTGFSIDGLGFRPTYVVLASIAVLPAMLLLLRPSIAPAGGAHETAGDRGGALELLANAGLRRAIVMSGLALTGIELFTFYFPVYGRAIGLSASAIGMVMASYAVAAFIVRIGVRRAARRVGELGVLTASLFVAGTTYLLVPMVSHAILLALMAFLLGLGLGCAQPLTIMLTYSHAPRGRSGEALGMRLTVNKLTQIAVPLVFGGLGSAFGLVPVFWANGAFLLAGAFLSLTERRMASPRPHRVMTNAERQEET